MRLAVCFLIGALGGWAVGFAPILAWILLANPSVEVSSVVSFFVCMATGCAGVCIAMERWDDLT